MLQEYDSSKDTLEHIKRVNQLLGYLAIDLINRGMIHDDSKLVEPEKGYFDRETPKLATLVFGSKEYSDSIKAIKPALEHHYANNRHHPQYFGEKGISGMTLLDLCEMFVDWKASGERGKDGNIYKSIEINKMRKAMNMSEQVAEIFVNTAEYLGYERLGSKNISNSTS